MIIVSRYSFIHLCGESYRNRSNSSRRLYLLRVTFYSNKTDELMSLKIIESRNKMIIEKVTRERFKYNMTMNIEEYKNSNRNNFIPYVIIKK